MGVLLVIGIILLVLWLLGFIFFKSIGALIHIALVGRDFNYHLAAKSSV